MSLLLEFTKLFTLTHAKKGLASLYYNLGVFYKVNDNSYCISIFFNYR